MGNKQVAEHGTTASYVGGCRCDPCKQANTDYMRRYRKSRGIPSRADVAIAQTEEAVERAIAQDEDIVVTVKLSPLSAQILLAKMHDGQDQNAVIDEALRVVVTVAA